MFAKLYQLEDDCGMPANTSLAQAALQTPGDIPTSTAEMQQQVAAAVAEQQAAVLRRVSEAEHAGIDISALQQRLLQAATAAVPKHSTADPEVTMASQQAPQALQALGSNSLASSPPLQLQPDTPSWAASYPRIPHSSCSPPGKAVPLPLQQSKGSLRAAAGSMPPPPPRMPSIPFSPSPKVCTPWSSLKPASSGSPSAAAGAPVSSSPMFSQVPANGFAADNVAAAASTSLLPVSTADTPGKPLARTPATPPSPTSATHIAPPPTHPAAAPAGLPMQGHILERKSCVLDLSIVWDQDSPARGTGSADLASGRQAPPSEHRDPYHAAQPLQQQQQ